MKIICYFLLLLPALSKAQTLTPMDLFVLRNVTETNSFPVIRYAVGILGKGHLKFLNRGDSIPSNRKHHYSRFRFSSGTEQTIVLTRIYSMDEETTYVSIIYSLSDERLYKQFVKALKDYKFSIVPSSMTKDGVPFQTWRVKTRKPEYHYLKMHNITIFKEKRGYKIRLSRSTLKKDYYTILLLGSML